MPRPTIFIPLEDIKGLKTLVDEGMKQDEIAAYYRRMLEVDVSQQTISNKVKELKEIEE